ncbi:MAG TPA: alcohol dehydrogenase catalytic domain-containing protein [Thermoanaerobaculia bacterium]|nr:alcohol dehydrogenase catalytic domain-containing protein [Thermoanaerobaculia bacterium]
MRALVSEGPERLQLREVPTPEPGPGDVLVRMSVALTCATDFKLVRRGHPKIPHPLTLGHEFAGVVERAGARAPFTPGERVTSAVSGPCGLCDDCRAGRENLCETAFERPLFGAFADFLLVPERIVKNGLRRIPPGLSDEAAALLDPLASVVHALSRVPAATGGDVLVVGTGPIAAMLFFLLRGKEGEREREKTGGATRRIVVAGRRPEKLAFFERNRAEVARIADSSRLRGAAAPPPLFTFEENEPMPPRIDSWEKRDLAVHSSPFSASLSSSFPLIIDTTGDPGVIEALPALAANGGSVVLFAGMAEGARVSLDAFAVHYREVSITGSFHYTPRDADAALALLGEGTIPVSSLVGARRDLSAWREAFDLAGSGGAMKVALVP